MPEFKAPATGSPVVRIHKGSAPVFGALSDFIAGETLTNIHALYVGIGAISAFAVRGFVLIDPAYHLASSGTG
jgi:hypothetical protein